MKNALQNAFLSSEIKKLTSTKVHADNIRITPPVWGDGGKQIEWTDELLKKHYLEVQTKIYQLSRELDEIINNLAILQSDES